MFNSDTTLIDISYCIQCVVTCKRRACLHHSCTSSIDFVEKENMKLYISV